jgi:hypothetical protein
MGDVTQNLRFGYEQALEAARQLWRLADGLDEAARGVNDAHSAAIADFTGPMRRQFEEQNLTNNLRLFELAGSCRTLASQLGRDWASARGQQDRINYQRYVEHRKAEESAFDNFKQWFVGEPDYGAAPDNPAPSTGPGFHATRCPQYSEFGP